MAVKVSVPIEVKVPSGAWMGFVRRIDSQLDLLVESSGFFKVGEQGSFVMEIPDVEGRIEGLVRVVKSGDRTGPFSRYILRIAKVTSRNARQFHAWLRDNPRAASGRSVIDGFVVPGAGDTIPPQHPPARGLSFPRKAVDVDVPITLRTDIGLVQANLRRFQGMRFAVESEHTISKGADIYFQFAVPSYGTVIYGTARLEQEVACYGRVHFYVLSLQLIRDSDRDLLVAWLHEVAPEDAFDDSDATTHADVSDAPGNACRPEAVGLPGALRDRLGIRSTTDPSDSAIRQASDIRASDGRKGLRDVFRSFFFGAPAAPAEPLPPPADPDEEADTEDSQT